jgi:ATP-dependent RNA helicase RhlE
MLRDPVRVAVTPQATTVERIEQRLIHVDRAGKPALLAEVLRQEPVERVLVFTRTKRGADKVVSGLAKAGLAAEAIHGNKSQNQRERVLAAFRAGRIRTLVATDIAARGIDVEGISHVVNYDLPNIPESYVHRIGRTARAGADGIAISFCDAEERAFLRDIEKLIRISIPATDRRSDKRAAPEPNGNGAAHPRQRQPQRQRNGNQSRDGRHPDARGDRKQAQKANHGSNHQQHRRADQKPARDANQQHRRVEQPAAAHDNIGAVAFMQQPRREQHRQSGGRPSRHAPR